MLFKLVITITYNIIKGKTNWHINHQSWATYMPPIFTQDSNFIKFSGFKKF